MVQLGVSYAHVARILNCTKLTITRLIQRYRVTGRTADRPRRYRMTGRTADRPRRYRVTGRTADRPRSGRPRVTTANEDCHLRILHLRNRFLTVTSSAATGLGHVISRHTVRRRLRQHGIKAYRPFRGTTLTRQHLHQRLHWACFNVGNSGAGNVYYVLMRAGSSYSELMA